ncbi:SDR family NAD(P)-dependent oxidoreductase [Thiomonas arsenitoxydans]|uniref:SDR family NAD(P)-dependent oxidoreductase n=1 Tax=Thiomonas arsenitoxydans (strain DSM 22701 / CIP 110005 / 3As) TaxID=426114 RepID=UPI001ACD958C|nr:SDR family NAD(P)-dependent oxidoreductase [Thiomonas arsenitoxydans]MBN8776336.1 SDR family NAD(P)-dependent oxidoreductase [Thiomonas arsenitoxydans]
MQLSGHSAIISGGASGLGRATAALLASRGMRVLIADLQEDAGQATAAEIGGQFMRCDVTQASDVEAAVQAANALAPLRVAVSCAGIAPAARTLGKQGPHALELFQRVININLVGSFNLARLAAAAMAQQPPLDDGERGVIVNTASVAAFDGQIGQVAYAASKAGIAGMTLPLARDLSRDGIRVMTIAPGIFETPMLMGMPAEVQAALGQMVPFPQRLGRPEEYAALVESILTNRMLNGEVIRLDGAIRMQPK